MRSYEAPANVEHFLDEAEHKIFALSERKTRPSFFRVRDIVIESMKAVEQLYERQEMVTGVPSGFVDLDKKTAGLQPGDLIIVAGRPSMGKTAFALNIAQYAALDAKTGVAVFSLEMSKEQLVFRMLCSEARVDQSQGARRLRRAARLSASWRSPPTASPRRRSTSTTRRRSRCSSCAPRRARGSSASATPTSASIIVDYLQLMRGTSSGQPRAGDHRDLALAEGAGQGAEPAGDRALAAQPAVETRADKTTPADGRPARVGRHRAGRRRDHVPLPRRASTTRRTPTSTIAEVIIGKQRNGPDRHGAADLLPGVHPLREPRRRRGPVRGGDRRAVSARARRAEGTRRLRRIGGTGEGADHSDGIGAGGEHVCDGRLRRCRRWRPAAANSGRARRAARPAPGRDPACACCASRRSGRRRDSRSRRSRTAASTWSRLWLEKPISFSGPRMARAAAGGRSSWPRWTPAASISRATSARSLMMSRAPAASVRALIARASATSSPVGASLARSCRSCAPPARSASASATTSRTARVGDGVQRIGELKGHGGYVNW